MTSVTKVEFDVSFFEKDFDSKNTSPLIQFDYSWASKAKTKKSRRQLDLSPAQSALNILSKKQEKEP